MDNDEGSQESRKTTACYQVLRATAHLSGQAFFSGLVRHLAQTLGAHGAFLTEIRASDPSRLWVVSSWEGDGPGTSFDYPMATQPCAQVMKNGRFHVSRDLATKFPQSDRFLRLGTESYVGVRMNDRRDQALGHLCLVNDQPIDDAEDLLEVLTLFAGLASSELQHLRQQEELRQERGRLEELLAKRSAELTRAQQQLDLLVHEDQLTGLANRRSFDRRFTAEWHRRGRTGFPIAVVRIDIDSLAAFKTQQGREVTERCIEDVAKVVGRLARRPGDVAARWANGEFALLLPETEPAGAACVAEAIRMAVRHLKIDHPQSMAAEVVTVSLGIAAVDHGERPRAGDALKRAEAAVRHASDEGGDRVVAQTFSPATRS